MQEERAAKEAAESRAEEMAAEAQRQAEQLQQEAEQKLREEVAQRRGVEAQLEAARTDLQVQYLEKAASAPLPVTAAGRLKACEHVACAGAPGVRPHAMLGICLDHLCLYKTRPSCWLRKGCTFCSCQGGVRFEVGSLRNTALWLASQPCMLLMQAGALWGITAALCAQSSACPAALPLRGWLHQVLLMVICLYKLSAGPAATSASGACPAPLNTTLSPRTMPPQ